MYEQEITISIQSVAIFLFFIVLMLGRGVYLLLSSPYVFRMDKKKNCCTREKKFIWQEKYKVKNLCKLSEVKEAIRTGGIFYNYVCLCLKLKSGKVISVFTDFYWNGFISSKRRSAEEFDKQIKEINSFLNNDRKQYIAEKTLIFWGLFWLLLGSILLISVGLTLYLGRRYHL